MTKEELYFYKEWFKNYCKSFYTTNVEEQRSIILKEIHTEKVCENIIKISESLSIAKAMNTNNIALAECIALFHDVGRFPQLQKYKTFRDSISVNHGVLGADVLSETHILEKLPDREQNIIFQSIKYHNAFKMPDIKDDELLHFIRLIRDADKLDIWRIFIEHYENTEDMGSAATLGISDTTGYSNKLLTHIYKKEMISLSNVSNLNDYKLLQLSWVFDLNFRLSFELFSEMDYLRRFLAKLPQTDEITKAVDFINDYINYSLN